MEHKGKETKLYKLNKELKKIHEDQRFEQEEERKKLLNKQNQLEVDKKKHSDEEVRFFRHKEQHTKMMEKEKEEQKKLQIKQNMLQNEKKKHADEEMRFLRHKEQHTKMMEKEKEEMKKEKEAQKIRQKKFYDDRKKFAAKEKKFRVWKENKSQKELDLEEREKNVLLKEKAYKSLSRQLTMQMAIHEEKERINERKVLDKEAEIKIKSNSLSSKANLCLSPRGLHSKSHDHNVHNEQFTLANP